MELCENVAFLVIFKPPKWWEKPACQSYSCRCHFQPLLTERRPLPAINMRDNSAVKIRVQMIWRQKPFPWILQCITLSCNLCFGWLNNPTCKCFDFVLHSVFCCSTAVGLEMTQFQVELCDNTRETHLKSTWKAKTRKHHIWNDWNAILTCTWNASGMYIFLFKNTCPRYAQNKLTILLSLNPLNIPSKSWCWCRIIKKILHFEWSPPWHHIETYLWQILTFFVLKSGEDEKERIVLMKSRALRSLDFIRIILSSSSLLLVRGPAVTTVIYQAKLIQTDSRYAWFKTISDARASPDA